MKLKMLGLLPGLLLLPTIHLCASTRTNYLTNIFYHKGKLSDKVACYFSQEPVITRIPGKPKQALPASRWQTIIFMVPKTGTRPEAYRSIRQMEEQLPQSYRINVEEVSALAGAANQGPIEGIAITVSYDSSKIGFEYETFTSIKEQPGVVFSLYHKDVLKELNAKTKPVQQYAMHKKPLRIVIDSGHGGEDAGKIGCFNIKEKDINLTVGIKVAHLLRKHGFTVLLTRNSDRFVPLERRTTFANTIGADLFVSIHANGASNPAASGIETYHMKPTLLRKEFMAHIDEKLQLSLETYQAHRYHKSYLLAAYIHQNTIALARTHHQTVRDRTIKPTVSQVLLGNERPSALIEIGFLSHQYEASLLRSAPYQQLIAQGICNGIVAFVNDHERLQMA